MELSDIKDYGEQRLKVLSVFIHKFRKFGWTVSLENRNAKTRKNSLRKIFIFSKRYPSLLESNEGKELVNKIFTNFLRKKLIDSLIERYSRKISEQVVLLNTLIK